MKKRRILTIISVMKIGSVLLFPLTTSAFLSSMGSAVLGKDAITDFIENQLNTSVKAGIQPLTKGLNVLQNKGIQPQVTITFSTPNPKSGEKITATAHVVGIDNPKTSYFTWYLRGPHREGGKESALSQQRANAIRAAAAVYFDPMVFDQKINGGNGDGILQDHEWPEDTDDDGFNAPVGDARSKGVSNQKCYMYDPETGVAYEKGDGASRNNGCPEGYEPQCLIERRDTLCPHNVPPITGTTETTTSSTTGDGGNTSSSSSGSTSFEGAGGVRSDRLTQCVATTDQPMCNDRINQLVCGTADGSVDTLYSYTPPINVSTPYCVKKSSSGQLWRDPLAAGCPRRMSEVKGMGCGYYMERKDIVRPGKCGIAEVRDEDKICGKDAHFFRGGADFVGDGKFTVEEERMFGLDPRTSRTTPFARNDEEFVTGVEMKELTWVYQEGDEVGVVVEGKGVVATKHDDATQQTVFAMLSPGCKGAIEETGSYE